MEKTIRRLDNLFNRLFTSRFNPLYSSGTIAVALLAIVTITGLYLCFFYRLGAPYESVSALQQDPWLGRWIRGLHRYASDAMVIAVAFHVLRMFIQRKHWGPRALAWITGVLLVVLMFISGWTGLVLVWDQHGQTIAVTGARIMDAIGIFSDPISRSFDGSVPPPASFFFLNLFLHIVIPLAMIFGIWLHTAKMKNASWFPERRLIFGMAGALFVVAAFWPAPLGEKADLLRIPFDYPTDWFFSFWLPAGQKAPLFTFLAWVAAVSFMVSIPFWLKPASRPEKASNDELKCVGCTQCVQDCPYEAIAMVPRTKGGGSEFVAKVNPDLCVSCGLCSASCAPFTMGLPGYRGGDQFAAARSFISSLRARSKDLKQTALIMACETQTGVAATIADFANRNLGYAFYPVPCAGRVHATVFEHFARNFQSVVIAACPERRCINKDGHRLLTERLGGQREPTIVNEVNRRAIHLMTVGEGEEHKLLGQIRFMRFSEQARKTSTRLISLTAAIALALGLAAATRIPFGEKAENGILRLSFRLSGQSVRTCRPRTEAELNQLPLHMRTPELCEQRMLSYRLRLFINEKLHLEQTVSPGGLHADRPIYFNRDLAFEPGDYRVHLEFSPADAENTSAISLKLDDEIRIEEGKIVLVHLSPDQKTLQVKGDGG